MKRITLLAILITAASFFSRSFSQESKIGMHIELGHAVEITKTVPTLTGQQLLLTPYYALNKNVNIGIGGGIKLYKSYQKYITSFPVYLNAVYKFNSSKIIPFIETKVGYSFMKEKRSGRIYGYYKEYPEGVDFNTEINGGFFLSPSAGVLFPLKNNHKISLSAAYVLDQDSFEAHGTQLNKTEKGTNTHHSIALRVGYSF